MVKVDRRIRWHYTTTILRLRIGARLTRYRNCKFHFFARTISRHADGISRYSVPPSAGPLLPCTSVPVDRLHRLASTVYSPIHFYAAQLQLSSVFFIVLSVCHNHGLCSWLLAVVKVVMCSRGGGSASEVETHKNIDSVLHTKTTFQAHSIFSVSIQK